MAMAGLDAPVTLAGALVMQNCYNLIGNVVAYLWGTSGDWSGSAHTMDLRSSLCSFGSPNQVLLGWAAIQLGNCLHTTHPNRWSAPRSRLSWMRSSPTPSPTRSGSRGNAIAIPRSSHGGRTRGGCALAGHVTERPGGCLGLSLFLGFDLLPLKLGDFA